MSDVAINQVIAQMRVMAAAAQSEGSDVANQVESGFASLMQDSIDAVNASMMEAKVKTQAFEMGDTNVSLTEVMVAGQRASLEFQAMTEVRNKLLSAYQEIMSMQV
ncbi:MAG: flagellar hook-basal body complex protein FliE [Pseudomonadota bacterium]